VGTATPSPPKFTQSPQEIGLRSGLPQLSRSLTRKARRGPGETHFCFYSIRRVKSPAVQQIPVGLLGVFAEHAEDLALNADAGSLGVDGGHLGVGGLEADEIAFAVEALEGSVGAVDEGDYDFTFAGGAGSFHQNIISADDVLVAHGVAADFQGVDLTVADDVAKGDGFRGFNGLYRLACGDAAEEREALEALLGGALRQHVNGAAAVVRPLQ